MEKYIVDRIEENFVILESKSGVNLEVPTDELPEVKEGEVVIFENGRYTLDAEETEKRRKIIEEKMRKLFEKK